MVTKPNTPMPASGQEPLKKLPKVESAELATNASSNPKYQLGNLPVKVADPSNQAKDISNADHGASFKLPEKISPASIKDQSFRYGGGRSAGNRSIADNMLRKVTEK